MRLDEGFYARSVHDVARELVGCVVRHGETAGRIVETESYHMEEPACHAFAGVTERTRTLFGPPGRAYVYFSYGIHSLLNAVAEDEGVGAAVLIRALEPTEGIEWMKQNYPAIRVTDLARGPGRLCAALGIGRELSGTDLVTSDRLWLERGTHPRIRVSTRIGLSRDQHRRLRFLEHGSAFVSVPP